MLYPKMLRIRQQFERPRIDNVPLAVRTGPANQADGRALMTQRERSAIGREPRSRSPFSWNGSLALSVPQVANGSFVAGNGS